MRSRSFTAGFVSRSETIFTAGLSGPPANKASIDLSNEPTQHSLLLDLYLLKSGGGGEKSGSFSTFPGICQIIDCFPSTACIFWNAWDWENGKGDEGTVGQVWTDGEQRERKLQTFSFRVLCKRSPLVQSIKSWAFPPQFAQTP